MMSKIFFSAILLCGFHGSQGLSNEAISRRDMVKAAVFSGVSSAFLNVDAASAYPRRDVGDPETRSAATVALNDQAFRTNNRLESQGFKLDTPEEEKARLSSALASFSYDDAASSKKKSRGGRGDSKSK